MKKIIYLLNIVFSIIFTQCTAQSTPQHISDPEADKFEGTWKWGNNINGVILIMKKENDINIFGQNDNSTLDAIIGFHKIYKNGFLTEDTTMFSNTNFIDKKKSFIANTSIHTPDPNELRVWMTHKNKNIEMKIVYVDPTHLKIIEVGNIEGVRLILPSQTAPSSAIDIPNNIILTKQ